MVTDSQDKEHAAVDVTDSQDKEQVAIDVTDSHDKEQVAANMTDSQKKEQVADDDCIPPLVKKRRTTYNQSVSDNFQVPDEIKAIKDNRVDDNCDKFHQLMNYLPQKYTCKIDKFERIESEGFLGAPPIAFEVHLWLTIYTAIDAQTWIQH